MLIFLRKSHSTNFPSTPQLHPLPSSASPENTNWRTSPIWPPSSVPTTAPSLGENSRTVPLLVAMATIAVNPAGSSPLVAETLFRFFLVPLRSSTAGREPQASEFTETPFSKVCSQRRRAVVVSWIRRRWASSPRIVEAKRPRWREGGEKADVRRVEDVDVASLVERWAEWFVPARGGTEGFFWTIAVEYEGLMRGGRRCCLLLCIYVYIYVYIAADVVVVVVGALLVRVGLFPAGCSWTSRRLFFPFPFAVKFSPRNFFWCVSLQDGVSGSGA